MLVQTSRRLGLWATAEFSVSSVSNGIVWPKSIYIIVPTWILIIVIYDMWSPIAKIEQYCRIQSV